MNSPSEEILENGSQRRKSIGLNLAGSKTRRHSIGVTSYQKSIGVVPNYLRASTGSCHDFCKFGKKHEQSKSSVPVKLKRTTIFNKDKVLKNVFTLEKKSTTIKPSTTSEIQTPSEPVQVTKKDVFLPSKKQQSSSTNRKTLTNDVKFHRSASLVKSSPVVANREGSNGGVKKRDLKTVKTTVAPKTGTFKKVVAKVTPNDSQSPKASFSRAAGLKAIRSKCAKQMAPLKDQNRMQKPEPKQTIADEVQTKSLDVVEAEPGVKPETMEIDFMESSMELVNPPVCSSSDSFSDENVLEQESPIIHPVYESSELFTDKEVLEEASVAPPVSESSESSYDDEVLENNSDYTDDEDAKVSSEGSETTNVNEMKTSVGNHKIPRKGKMAISEDNADKAVRLRFRRGKIIDLQSVNNSPRRLKFRRRVIEGNEDGQNISRKAYKNKTSDLQSEVNIPRKLKFSKGKVMEGNEDNQREARRSFEKKCVEETNESKNGSESVVLKHQGEQEKKDAQGLLNNVIEETASKLVESRKSKVKALVGAFETVISLQDGKPSSG